MEKICLIPKTSPESRHNTSDLSAVDAGRQKKKKKKKKTNKTKQKKS